MVIPNETTHEGSITELTGQISGLWHFCKESEGNPRYYSWTDPKKDGETYWDELGETSEEKNRSGIYYTGDSGRREKESSEKDQHLGERTKDIGGTNDDWDL